MSNEENKSKIVVYENGDLLNTDKCREVLMAYWTLNEAETRAFDRLQKRTDLKDKFLSTFKGLSDDH